MDPEDQFQFDKYMAEIGRRYAKETEVRSLREILTSRPPAQMGIGYWGDPVRNPQSQSVGERRLQLRMFECGTHTLGQHLVVRWTQTHYPTNAQIFIEQYECVHCGFRRPEDPYKGLALLRAEAGLPDDRDGYRVSDPKKITLARITAS